jgi:Inositol monophosphatase family
MTSYTQFGVAADWIFFSPSRGNTARVLDSCLPASWQRRNPPLQRSEMTKRSARSNRAAVALFLAGAVSSKAWVLRVPTTPTTRTRTTPSSSEVPRHHHDARSFARPLSRLSASEEGITFDILVAEGGSLIRPSWESDLTIEDLQELLDTAQEAARAAGKVIVSHLGCCSQSSSASQEECEIKYSIKDIVTQYDQQAQQVVKDIVLAQFPAHRFLGEEDVGAGGAASQAALEAALRGDDSDNESRSPFLWICDPIDVRASRLVLVFR